MNTFNFYFEKLKAFDVFVKPVSIAAAITVIGALVAFLMGYDYIQGVKYSGIGAALIASVYVAFNWNKMD